MKLTKEEIIAIIDQYLQDRGLWHDFRMFIEAQGYTVEELGLKDED